MNGFTVKVDEGQSDGDNCVLSAETEGPAKVLIGTLTVPKEQVPALIEDLKAYLAD